jgi:hypothetical protein
VDLRLELTARVVSFHPLTLDVLNVDGPAQKVFAEQCGFTIFVPLVDVRLKGILSKLKFNELVKAALFYGGNQEFPHEYVLSELTAVATVPSNGIAGTGPSLSGLLLSYREPVEYVNVYNDGTILYQDVLFNRFATQKLSPDELAQVLGTFAAQNFSSLPSTPPTGDLRAYRNSLTLICTRLQNVSLSGLETKLSPLIARLEDLKARATSQTFYLLLKRLADAIGGGTDGSAGRYQDVGSGCSPARGNGRCVPYPSLAVQRFPNGLPSQRGQRD